MTARKRVTIVNDHPEFLELLSDFLGEEGYDVTTFPKHQGAFEQIKSSCPDAVICDLMFDNLPSGWALIDMLYLDAATRPIPVILCSAATRYVQEIAPSLAGKGIRWLEKPFALEKLLEILAEIDTGPESKLREHK
ncbi:MAG TPA: response regulator [Kouleothrix sp.]|nr:response regulator [Kouleothrix sp.]HRC76304.1 response regulator [Kouleothrix sp.]